MILFALALWRPQWWHSAAARVRIGESRYVTQPVARIPGRDGRANVDLRAEWQVAPAAARFVPLSPPVAAQRAAPLTRVAVPEVVAPTLAESPADEIPAEAGEAGRGQRLDAEPLARRTISSDAQDAAPSGPLPGTEVGPVITPGAQLTSGADFSLELSPSDLRSMESNLPPDARHATSAVASTSAQEESSDSSAAAAASDEIASNWPVPAQLRQDLDRLQPTNAQVASWQRDVIDALDELAGQPSYGADEVSVQLRRLERLAAETERLETLLPTAEQIHLRRVRYAMERRCAVWQAARRVATEQLAAPRLVHVSDALPIIQEVRQRVATHPQAKAWANFLMLDRLSTIAAETWVTDPAIRREAARTVLQRLAARDFTAEQHAMLNDRAIRDLENELRAWAEQPIDLSYLLATLERFEQLRSDACAAELVAMLDALRYSRQPSAAELAETLNTHYRNANVRISVSGELLNSLLPVLEPIQQQIRDTILGAEVVGQNQTWTDLNVTLIDDDQHLHLRLRADGRSRTRSVSSKGPVRLLSREQSRFHADKDLVVSPQGMYVSGTTAVAQSGDAKVLGVETDFDEVPLLGWIIRQLALDEHRAQRGQVRLEIQNRIKRQATQQLDRSVNERLTGAEQKLDATLLDPLRKLELDPQAVEMKTANDRLVMRFRLASNHQLAAYTPRPRARTDSVLSLQLHESVVNNLLEQLDLEDERVELEQLIDELATKLKLDRAEIHEEIPEGITVRLASDRPIQVEFAEDRVVLMVRIQELTTPKRKWHNFVVRGRYRADLGETHVDLAREGGIELISEQIGFRDQVALRGIFTKVLARNHRLNIVQGRAKSHAILSQLSVTQFVARDGWIGISVGQDQAQEAPTLEVAAPEASGPQVGRMAPASTAR